MRKCYNTRLLQSFPFNNNLCLMLSLFPNLAILTLHYSIPLLFMGILIICSNLNNLKISLQAGRGADHWLSEQLLLLDNSNNDKNRKFPSQHLRISAQSLTREACSFIRCRLTALLQFTIYGNSGDIPKLTRELEFFHERREDNPPVTTFRIEQNGERPIRILQRV
jgi:hypothetical protein